MPNILLIEDDEQLAAILTRFLNSEGYATSHADGQREGLRLFAENKYDCVLLDVSLRDGSGYSVCAAIKKESDTPVIFITASGTKPARWPALRWERTTISASPSAPGSCWPG